MKTYLNFTACYYDLAKQIYNNAEFESAPRGLKIKERLGSSFKILNIRDRLPFTPARYFNLAYCFAEILWYLNASNSTEWISYYAPFWKSISDDGLTANSAYGARIFAPHHRIASSVDSLWTQWNYVKDEIKSDPDSRRAVIHIRSPQDSLLAKKDVPCTLTLQFFLRDNKLHQCVNMRSSDLILGIAYDVPAFTMFQELLAYELGVDVGTYMHTSNSLHIYEKHFGMVENMLDEAKSFYNKSVPMPAMTFPDYKRLYEVEKQIRNTTVEELKQYKHFNTLNIFDSYWKDWANVLIQHKIKTFERSSQLEKEMSSMLLSMLHNEINFDSYNFFNKKEK